MLFRVLASAVSGTLTRRDGVRFIETLGAQLAIEGAAEEVAGMAAQARMDIVTVASALPKKRPRRARRMSTKRWRAR